MATNLDDRIARLDQALKPLDGLLFTLLAVPPVTFVLEGMQAERVTRPVVLDGDVAWIHFSEQLECSQQDSCNSRQKI